MTISLQGQKTAVFFDFGMARSNRHFDWPKGRRCRQRWSYYIIEEAEAGVGSVWKNLRLSLVLLVGYILLHDHQAILVTIICLRPLGVRWRYNDGTGMMM